MKRVRCHIWGPTCHEWFPGTIDHASWDRNRSTKQEMTAKQCVRPNQWTPTNNDTKNDTKNGPKSWKHSPKPPQGCRVGYFSYPCSLWQACLTPSPFFQTLWPLVPTPMFMRVTAAILWKEIFRKRTYFQQDLIEFDHTYSPTPELASHVLEWHHQNVALKKHVFREYLEWSFPSFLALQAYTSLLYKPTQITILRPNQREHWPIRSF